MSQQSKATEFEPATSAMGSPSQEQGVRNLSLVILIIVLMQLIVVTQSVTIQILSTATIFLALSMTSPGIRLIRRCSLTLGSLLLGFAQEQKSASGRDLMKLAIDRMPIGVVMFDESGELVAVNTKFRQIYGIADERIDESVDLRKMLELRFRKEDSDREQHKQRIDTLHDGHRINISH